MGPRCPRDDSSQISGHSKANSSEIKSPIPVNDRWDVEGQHAPYVSCIADVNIENQAVILAYAYSRGQWAGTKREMEGRCTNRLWLLLI